MTPRKPPAKHSTQHRAGRANGAGARHGLPKAEPSAPEITTALGPAGRDTMAAIAAEVAPDIATLSDVFEDEVPEPSGTRHDAPEIEVGQRPAGRETLSAIAQEMLRDVAEEPVVNDPGSADGDPRHTMGYENQPATRPGLTVERPRMTTLDYTERPATTRRSPHTGTPDVVDDQVTRWANAGTSPRRPQNPGAAPAVAPEFEIHEMVTFVVKGDLARLSSTTARRDFVRERLLHRLPVQRIDEVERIDVTPWTVRGTVIVRVWCRI